MALALYRKYRPATFAEVVGQEHVTEPLRTALAAGRINHAYLFSGPRGCGKTSSARILARSLNCVQGPTPDPCGVCDSCVALAPEGPGSLDVVELDAASHGGVDDTRELRDRAFYMPAQSRYRVFIIDEAHMVTTQGFNALLKIVEEPPEHLVFIFATTEPDKVLTTIRSRTHHYPFRLIPPATLRALLEKLCTEEGVTVAPAVFPLVIRAGGGSARDSLSVLDQLLAGAGPEGVTYAEAVALLGVTDAALLDEMVDALAAGDGAAVFGAVDKVVEAGHDPRRFAADLLQRLRDLVILAQVPAAAANGLIDAPQDQLAAMVAQAERLGAATAARFAELLHTGLIEMRGTTTPRLTLELMCARMLLPAATLGDGALLQRLERMERRLAIASDGAAELVPARPPVNRLTEAPPVNRPAEAPPADDEPDLSSPATAPAARRSGPDLGLPPPPTLSSRGGARPSAARQPPPTPDAGAAPAGATRRAAPSGTSTAAPGGAAPGPTHEEPQPASPRASPADQPRTDHPRTGQPRTGQPHTGETGTDQPSTDQTPADQAHAGSPRALDSTDVRKVWAEVLVAVQKRRRTTQILLESATVSRVDKGALVLSMPSAGMARRVVEPANADLLKAALHEVLGVDWVIRCEAADALPPAAGTRGPATPVPSADTPPPPDDDDIPDDYGDEPAAGAAALRDPEEVAIELVTAKLGAKRLES